MQDKDYIVIVQCHLVKQRCPGYLCEKAFHERDGGFAGYPAEKAYRTLYLTCGGCCGRALQRKLTLLARSIKKKEQVGKDRILIQLSSCMCKDNYHGPPCPHLDYIRELITRAGFDIAEGTVISKIADKRREEGVYKK